MSITLTTDEKTDIGNFIDSCTDCGLIEIPYPLSRTIKYRREHDVVCISIDFGRVYEQMKYWNYNKKNNFI